MTLPRLRRNGSAVSPCSRRFPHRLQPRAKRLRLTAASATRVYELTHEDLDPPRGWRLVKMLVDRAGDDRELWTIGSEPLAWIVDSHADLVGSELAELYRTHPRWRMPFKGQISRALFEFEKQLAATNSQRDDPS